MTDTFSGDIDDLTRQVIAKAYALFCAEHRTKPSALMAKLFAVEVTGSGAKQFHGMDEAQLEKMLGREFGKQR